MKHVKRLGLVLAAALLLAAFPMTALAEEAAVVEAEALTKGQTLKAGTVIGITKAGNGGSRELAITTETSGDTPSKLTEVYRDDGVSTKEVVYTLKEDSVVCAVQTGVTTSSMSDKRIPPSTIDLIFSEVRHDPVSEGDSEAAAQGTACYLKNGRFETLPITGMEYSIKDGLGKYKNYGVTYNGTSYMSGDGYSFKENSRAVWVYLQPVEPESPFTEPVYYPDYDDAEPAGDEPEQAAPAQAYAVICRTLNVRATPATQLPRIARVYRGDTLRVLEVLDNGWARIEWTGGPDGCAYVSAKYIQAAH